MSYFKLRHLGLFALAVLAIAGLLMPFVFELSPDMTLIEGGLLGFFGFMAFILGGGLLFIVGISVWDLREPRR